MHVCDNIQVPVRAEWSLPDGPHQWRLQRALDDDASAPGALFLQVLGLHWLEQVAHLHPFTLHPLHRLLNRLLRTAHLPGARVLKLPTQERHSPARHACAHTRLREVL